MLELAATQAQWLVLPGPAKGRAVSKPKALEAWIIHCARSMLNRFTSAKKKFLLLLPGCGQGQGCGHAQGHEGSRLLNLQVLRNECNSCLYKNISSLLHNLQSGKVLLTCEKMTFKTTQHQSSLQFAADKDNSAKSDTGGVAEIHFLRSLFRYPSKVGSLAKPLVGSCSVPAYVCHATCSTYC